MSYLKLPKQLFKDPEYKNLSANAKLLYALLLDRHSLSEKNNKTDDDGKTVVYFKRKEAGELLNLSVRSIQKVYEELKASGLLWEKSQGIGKAYLLYVKNFRSQCTKSSDADVQKLPPSNTELNKTDINKTELSKELKEYFFNYSLGIDDGDGPVF